MTKQDEVRVVLISSISAIFVGFISSLITGVFLTRSNEIIAEKDVKVINAQNTQKNLEVLQSKAESYIDSVMDLVIYLQAGKQIDANEVKKLSLSVQKNGFKLMVYAGPELASKSIELSNNLQQFVNLSASKPLDEKMKELQISAVDWYKAYFIEMSKYNYQAT